MSGAVGTRAIPARALERAQRRSRGGALGTAPVEIAPIESAPAFAAACAAGQDAALWLRPDDGRALLAVGSAATVTARGAGRILALRHAWSELRGDAADGTGPCAFVGVSFDERGPAADGPAWGDLPPALLVAPRVLVEWREGSARAQVTSLRDDDAAEAEVEHIGEALASAARRPEPDGGSVIRLGDLPPRDRWRADVARARDEIRRGALEKVVLARTMRLGVRPRAEEAAIAILARRTRGCTVYAVGRGDSVLVGATPESLVSLAAGVARVSCVAGTAPRGSASDDASGSELLRSAKDRQEQAVVVRAAADALGPLCDDVTVTEPGLLPLATLWHLSSDVTGRARAGVELLDLAAALHPTPAVCGEPRAAAAALLAEAEPFERGWYAGALGWVDARGEGELVVALRCALVRAREAWVFAGCGIVDASDPDTELAESDAKMRPMIEALGG